MYAHRCGRQCGTWIAEEDDVGVGTTASAMFVMLCSAFVGLAVSMRREMRRLVGGNCLGSSAVIVELAVEEKRIVCSGSRNRLNEILAYHHTPRAKPFTVIEGLLRHHDDLESVPN